MWENIALTSMHLSECWRTAFHEAGHSDVALYIDPLYATKARIYWRGGLWFGDSQIATSKMDDIQKTAVALAGLFAEARAAAEAKVQRTSSLDKNRCIAGGKRLMNELDRVIGVALENRVQGISSRMPIQDAPGELIDVLSVLSLEDIEYIPDTVLDAPETLRKAANLALRVINDNSEWASVRAIAEIIVKREPEWVEDLAAVRVRSSA
jgi:hypothetical protein